MGWTGIFYNDPTIVFNKKGEVNKKKTIDKIMNTDEWEVIKSVMDGNTWYGAIKNQKSEIFGMVVRVKNSKENREFIFKEISEDMGPCYYNCPNTILDLLGPTEFDYAKKWREDCRKWNKIKSMLKSHPNITIEFNNTEVNLFWYSGVRNGFYTDGHYRYGSQQINPFTVLKINGKEVI